MTKSEPRVNREANFLGRRTRKGTFMIARKISIPPKKRHIPKPAIR